VFATKAALARKMIARALDVGVTAAWVGLVVAVVVLAASAHENTAGIALLDRVAAQAGTVRTALVDQGSKNAVAAHGATLGIEVRTVGRNPADKGFAPSAQAVGGGAGLRHPGPAPAPSPRL